MIFTDLYSFYWFFVAFFLLHWDKNKWSEGTQARILWWGSRRMMVKELKHQRRMHHHQLLLWHKRWLCLSPFWLWFSKVAEPASQPTSQPQQSKPLHPKTSSKHNNNNNNKTSNKISVNTSVAYLLLVQQTNTHRDPFFRSKAKSLTRKEKITMQKSAFRVAKARERKKEKNP